MQCSIELPININNFSKQELNKFWMETLISNLFISEEPLIDSNLQRVSKNDLRLFDTDKNLNIKVGNTQNRKLILISPELFKHLSNLRKKVITSKENYDGIFVLIYYYNKQKILKPIIIKCLNITGLKGKLSENIKNSRFLLSMGYPNYYFFGDLNNAMLKLNNSKIKFSRVYEKRIMSKSKLIKFLFQDVKRFKLKTQFFCYAFPFKRTDSMNISFKKFKELFNGIAKILNPDSFLSKNNYLFKKSNFLIVSKNKDEKVFLRVKKYIQENFSNWRIYNLQLDEDISLPTLSIPIGSIHICFSQYIKNYLGIIKKLIITFNPKFIFIHENLKKKIKLEMLRLQKFNNCKIKEIPLRSKKKYNFNPINHQLENILDNFKVNLANCKKFYEEIEISRRLSGEIFSLIFDYEINIGYSELFSKERQFQIKQQFCVILISIEFELDNLIVEQIDNLIEIVNFEFFEGYLHWDSHKEVYKYPHALIPFHSFYPKLINEHAFIILDSGVEQLPKYFRHHFKNYLESKKINISLVKNYYSNNERYILQEEISQFLNFIDFSKIYPFINKFKKYILNYAQKSFIIDIPDIPSDVFLFNKHIIFKIIRNNFELSNLLQRKCLLGSKKLVEIFHRFLFTMATVQYKFEDYNSFKKNFDIIYSKSNYIGIGNLCRSRDSNFFRKIVKYIIKKNSGKKHIHFFGIGKPLVKVLFEMMYEKNPDFPVTFDKNDVRITNNPQLIKINKGRYCRTGNRRLFLLEKIRSLKVLRTEVKINLKYHKKILDFC